MTPDDPRHGQNKGYAAGCRDHCCRHAHMVEKKRWLLTGRRTIDSTGARRRIEALEALGWNRAELSGLLGRARTHLREVVKNERIYTTTHDAIADLYDQLSMSIPPDGPWRNRTRNRARRLGYRPPLAWDDIDNDPEPPAHEDEDGIDHVLVARVLAGEWRLPATPDERAEVVRQWVAGGGTLRQLARRSGWKPERYYKQGEDAA